MKHISKIADDYLEEVERLQDVNAKLTKENKTLRKELARVLGSDYAGDIEADDDSCGREIEAQLKG